MHLNQLLKIMKDVNLHRQIRSIMSLADKANQFIDHHKPWQMVKEEDKKDEVLGICSLAINLFKILITYLKPVLPELAYKSEQFLNVSELDFNSVHQPLLLS